MFLLQKSSDSESWENVKKDEHLDVLKGEKMRLNHLAILSGMELRIIAQDQHGKRIFPDCLYDGSDDGFCE